MLRERAVPSSAGPLPSLTRYVAGQGGWQAVNFHADGYNGRVLMKRPRQE